MSQTPAPPQVTGKMFLFNRPELLNKEQHGHLGLDPAQKPFEFCANVRALPLTVSEIPSAMKDYPVIFMSAEDLTPLAVVGLIDDINLFVDDDGQWQDGAYIPAYLRRYPFALATEQGGQRHAIVFDAGHPGVREGGEIRFFDPDGQSSDATKQAIEFCTQYERDRLTTTGILKDVQAMGLVKPQTAQYTPQGENEPRAFAQYFGVDEGSLRDLSDEDFLKLRKSNVLPILYAQLMSLGNWRHLLNRRAKRFGLDETQVLQPIAKN